MVGQYRHGRRPQHFLPARRPPHSAVGYAVDEPELLLYEPESNGELRLVAVEYIVPKALSAIFSATSILAAAVPTRSR